MNFGCKLSAYDSRDYRLKSGVTSGSNLPESYSCPLLAPVKNQRQVSSCVAHAVSSILEYHAVPYRILSTNFIYGIQKELFNREGKGMILRDACKIAADYGDMVVEDCPGNTEVPDCYSIASSALSDEEKVTRASNFRILKYFLCTSADDIKHALYNYGPVLGSLKWYSDYTVDKNGTLVGGQSKDFGYHAIMIYGYTPDGFWCQNSWGRYWGKSGRFFVPNSIKFWEARGFVDWNGSDELKEPKLNSFTNIMYKCFNVLVNIIRKLFIKE